LLIFYSLRTVGAWLIAGLGGFFDAVIRSSSDHSQDHSHDRDRAKRFGRQRTPEYPNMRIRKPVAACRSPRQRHFNEARG